MVSEKTIEVGGKTFRRRSIHEDTTNNVKPAWYMGEANKRIGIAISTFGAQHTAFVRSLLGVIRDALFRGYVLDIVIEETKPLDVSRCVAVKELMENDPDYILFLDSDMVFPRSLIHVLAEDKKDLVSGIYATKEQTPKPVLKLLNKENGHYETIWSYPRGETFEVDAVGCGCLLVKTEVFKKLEEPYFLWDTQRSVSEDIYFCRKAKEAGCQIWCDSRLECGHISDVAFVSMDDFWRKRMEYEKNPESCPDVMMSQVRKIEKQ